MSSVVYQAFHQINKTGKVQLCKSHHPDYKNGDQKPDFLYINNALKMTVFLAEQKITNGYLGSEHVNTWLSLVKPIFKTISKPENIVIRYSRKFKA